jgi:integrase
VKRRTLATYGRRGDRVRVLVDKREQRVEVHYRDRSGIPHKRVFPLTKEGQAEAIVWAESYHTERDRLEAARTAPPATTLRQLWRTYTESPAYRKDLRDATRIAYTERFGLWMAFLGEEFVAADTTLHDVDRFIVRMETVLTRRGKPKSTNQVRMLLQVVRTVYNWGQSRKLLATNELALFRWKTPKDAVVLEPDEYSDTEYRAILAELSPQHAKRWRGNVATILGGASGQRAAAIRHLRWSDVDLEKGVIVWPKQYQKQGKELERPITSDIRAALFTALYWRERVAGGRVRSRAERRKSGATPEALASADWVLFAEHDRSKPVSYQTLHAQLVGAEARAGVPHRDYRATHGWRRMVVGEIGEATGDIMRGLEYVGDRDLKQKKSYDRRLQKRVNEAAEVLSKVSLNRPSTKTTAGPESGAVVQVKETKEVVR